MRDNMHAGLIAATVANVHRGKNRSAYTPNDFMFEDEQSKKLNETAQVMAFFTANAKNKKS